MTESETAPKGFEKHATTPANTGWCFLETPWSQAWIEMPEVVADAIIADHNQARRVPGLVKALEDAATRMERARSILQERNNGNWGMLDTSEARAALIDAEVTE